MTVNTNKATTAKQAPARKPMGIKKETRGASSLKFNPDPAVNDGLCLGALVAVTIGKAEYKEDQKGNFADFAGKSVPTINFVWEGIPAVQGAATPVYIHSFKPMPIVPGSTAFDWFYDSMFQTIKHWIDVFTGDNFLDAYEDLLDLNIDLDNGMSVEALNAAYDAFFNGIVAVFNGNETLPCIYKNDDQPKLAWMKLLRYTTNAKGVRSAVNNGDPGFSGYPGEGHIELYVANVKPMLHINIAKGEDIIAKERPTNNPTPPPATTTGAPAGVAGGTGAPAGLGASNVPGFMSGKK